MKYLCGIQFVQKGPVVSLYDKQKIHLTEDSLNLGWTDTSDPANNEHTESREELTSAS